MLLSGKQIAQRKIIDNIGPKSLREASYDVRVGSILAKPLDSIGSTPAKAAVRTTAMSACTAAEPTMDAAAGHR